MAEDNRGGIKPTIISNIEEATKNLASNEAMQKEDDKIAMLSSINDTLKEQNKQFRKSEKKKTKDSVGGMFNTPDGDLLRSNNEKNFKVFNKMSDILEEIKKNTKKITGVWDFLILALGIGVGLILAAFKKVAGVLKLLGAGVGTLFKNVGKNLWKLLFPAGIKDTRLFKFFKTFRLKFMLHAEIFRMWLKSETALISVSFKRFTTTLKESSIGKVITKITDFLSKGSLSKNLQKVLEGKSGLIGKLKSFFGKTGPIVKIGSTLKPILTLLKGLGGPIFAFGEFVGKKLLPPLVILFAIIDGVKGFFKAAEFFGKKEGEAVTLGEKIASSVGSILNGFLGGLLGDTGNVVQGVFNLFSGNWKEFFGKNLQIMMGSLIDKVFKLVKWVFGVDEGSWVDKAFNFIRDGFKGFLLGVSNLVAFFFDPEQPLWKKVLVGISTFFFTIPTLLFTGIKAFFEQTNTGQKIWETVKIWWTNSVNFIVEQWNGMIENMSNFFSMNTFTKLGDIIREQWNGTIKNIKSFFSIKALSSVTDTIIEAFTGMIDSIKEWWKNLSIKDVIFGKKEDSKPDPRTTGIMAKFKTQEVQKAKREQRAIKQKQVTNVKILKEIQQTKPSVVAQEKRKLTSLDVKDLTDKEKARIVLESEKSGTVIPELSDKKKDNQVLAISKDMNENQRTKFFMDFLQNQFSNTMATKIAVAMGKGGGVNKVEDVEVTPIIVR